MERISELTSNFTRRLFNPCVEGEADKVHVLSIICHAEIQNKISVLDKSYKSKIWGIIENSINNK